MAHSEVAGGEEQADSEESLSAATDTTEKSVENTQAIADAKADGRKTLKLLHVTSRDLAQISELTQLETLEIFSSDFAADEIKQLHGLTHLKNLRLEDVALTDEEAMVISTFSELEVLNLPATVVTDRGLGKFVAGLPKLLLLRMGSPKISDKGIASLTEFSSLRWLHLVDVPITDRGGEAFYAMHDLESLYIDGGKMTDAGIGKLLKENPKLHFHVNQTHVEGDPNADDH